MMQRFPLSGHTSVRLSCLSNGPVGPLTYFESSEIPKMVCCLGSESGYCSSPQWPVKYNQFTGVLLSYTLNLFEAALYE
jgi:hypothetical protein